MIRDLRTITVASILLLAILSLALPLSQQGHNRNKVSDKQGSKYGQTRHKWQGSDSTPVIHISNAPLQQPPQMVSLQIHERSTIIQTYTSPTGGKILFDFISKNYQQLTMRLKKRRQDTVLWAQNVQIEGYHRQVLEVEPIEAGQYKLKILSPGGKPLQKLQILKSG